MPSVPILMYHNIGIPSPEDRKPKLYVRVKTFARQMAILRFLGFRGISMREAMPYLRGDSQGKVVVITFDDGYVDNIEHALPVLLAYGHTATCYVVSHSIGLYNTWDSAAIHSHKPIMNKEQLQRWCAAGMEVGAHTQTHPRLANCDEPSIMQEIAGSKTELEQLLQIPVSQFCYPYGNLDERVVQAVRAAGYEAATTTNPGIASNEDDLYLLPREKMTGYSHLFHALLAR